MHTNYSQHAPKTPSKLSRVQTFTDSPSEHEDAQPKTPEDHISSKPAGLTTPSQKRGHLLAKTPSLSAKRVHAERKLRDFNLVSPTKPVANHAEDPKVNEFHKAATPARPAAYTNLAVMAGSAAPGAPMTPVPTYGTMSLMRPQPKIFAARSDIDLTPAGKDGFPVTDGTENMYSPVTSAGIKGPNTPLTPSERSNTRFRSLLAVASVEQGDHFMRDAPASPMTPTPSVRPKRPLVNLGPRLQFPPLRPNPSITIPNETPNVATPNSTDPHSNGVSMSAAPVTPTPSARHKRELSTTSSSDETPATKKTRPAGTPISTPTPHRPATRAYVRDNLPASARTRSKTARDNDGSKFNDKSL